MGQQLRIGVLVSGGGSNLQAIMDACRRGTIDGTIVFVGADNPDAGGLQRAHAQQIPTFWVDYSRVIRQFKKHPASVTLPADFDLTDMCAKQGLFGQDTNRAKMERFLSSRAIAEAALLDSMAPYPFDLLVLAGFMRNLTPYFIDRINPDPQRPRIMNIHPALLPAFPGMDGYGDTFRYGCKVAGCTVHFIDYGEDSGPIIGQAAFDISADDSLETVKQKGLQREWALYPKCIQLFAQDRLRVIERKEESSGKSRPGRKTVQILPDPTA